MSEICLVTGCAGFIGSHLAERLLSDGHTVVGVDAFTDHYSRVQKEANIAAMRGRPGFEFVEGDLTKLDPVSLMDGITVVFHLAGHETARSSWGRDFATHTRNTILATQLMLEASLHVKRFVYTSASSVYGNVEAAAMSEDLLPSPVSPYGAAKLAGEALCHAYASTSNVPTIALRLFGVYGPRQRPDQAFHRFIRAMLEGRPVDIFGDGEEARDYLYVTDAVEACVAALSTAGRGEVYNVGSGKAVSLHAVLDILKTQLEQPLLEIRHHDPQRGDVRKTLADLGRARARLSFEPRVTLEEGLAEQIKWLRSTLVSAPQA